MAIAACTNPSVAPADAAPVVSEETVIGSGIAGGDPEFTYSAMIWQGYWLSRDHFGPLVMGSGMGIPFQPPADMVQMSIQMVAQNPEDPVMIPKNMAPLQAVFASAGPGLIHDPREFDPLDFEALRLNEDSFDKSISLRGQAMTMLKESQWAHSFASPHFGNASDSFGAQQRFMGMMVSMLAQMQGQYAMQNLMGEDGLYHDSDGTLDYIGNWVMLHALSDISGLTGDESGRYANPDAHPMFESATTQLFQALEDRRPQSPQESATAIRALVYRASTTVDSGVRDEALAKAAAIADGHLVDLDSGEVVETAAAIAGLVAVAVATDDSTYLSSADRLFQSMLDDFDPNHGVFDSKSVYDVDDVAWIIGGLNFLSQRGGSTSKAAAKVMLLAFYESTISVAGMQLAAPPGKDGAMAGEWEKDLPSVLYYHPANTPPPPMAGTLPVPAEEIAWDGNAWRVTSDRFVTGGAMHLSNELNWLGPHLGSVPFPPIKR